MYEAAGKPITQINIDEGGGLKLAFAVDKLMIIRPT